MKKLIGILVVIIFLFVGAVYYVYANAAPILADIISHKTLTPVSIKEIEFYRNAFEIKELKIDNPKEARLQTALKSESITVAAPYRQYFWDPIEIEKIEMSDVYVNIQIYDKDQKEGNWQTIVHNMSIDHKSPLSIERSALIKKLVLTNIQIDLILSDGKLRRLSPIDRLEFDNITSDKGIPTQEISEIIVQKVMHSIFLEQGLKSVIEAPVNVIKGVLPFL